MTLIKGISAAAILLGLTIAIPAITEELTGAERLLCKPGRMSHCVDGQGCEYGPPGLVNIPDFIEIDLANKTLKTTEASGDERSSPIDHSEKEAGYIYLQGVEHGRAYSIVIAESSGELAFTVATHGKTATMFGACTVR